MAPLETVLLFLASLAIGGVAAVLGLGGGIFLVPLLILACDLAPKEAAAVALMCTLVTSGAGSVALDKGKLADLPLVVLLELPAVIGSGIGAAFLAQVLDPAVVMGLFAAVVSWSAWRMVLKARRMTPRIESLEVPEYVVQRKGLGMLGSFAAGMASGLLGIGGGPIKVPVMTEIMRLPLKVALATSNLMVGITAATGAAIYYAGGWLKLGLLAPCALGFAIGAYCGGLLAPRLRTRYLTFAFSGILALLALRLIWKSIELAS